MARLFSLFVVLACTIGGSMVSAQSSTFGDVQQAQKFLASLPPACEGNYQVLSDGKVVVSYVCKDKSGKLQAGNIHMKDGKVVDVK